MFLHHEELRDFSYFSHSLPHLLPLFLPLPLSLLFDESRSTSLVGAVSFRRREEPRAEKQSASASLLPPRKGCIIKHGTFSACPTLSPGLKKK